MQRESTKCYTVKHDHRRNFKSLNIIWCIVYFFLHLLRRLIFSLSRNTSSILHSMLNAKRFEIVYALHHLYIMYSNVFINPGIKKYASGLLEQYDYIICLFMHRVDITVFELLGPETITNPRSHGTRYSGEASIS